MGHRATAQLLCNVQVTYFSLHSGKRTTTTTLLFCVVDLVVGYVDGYPTKSCPYIVAVVPRAACTLRHKKWISITIHTNPRESDSMRVNNKGYEHNVYISAVAADPLIITVLTKLISLSDEWHGHGKRCNSCRYV